MALTKTYERFSMLAKLVSMCIILLRNCAADETGVQSQQGEKSLTEQNCSNKSKYIYNINDFSYTIS